MARRTYKRDKLGRFAGTGGGGIKSKSKGGKMGKSAKNTKARAKYKQSRQNVKDAENMRKVAAGSRGKGAKKFASRQVAGSKSGATRIKRGLQGGKKSLQGSFKGLSQSASKSKPRKSAAATKKSLIRRESQRALSGKKVSPQKGRYIRSQQQEKMRVESSRGKGSKAKRRAAKLRR